VDWALNPMEFDPPDHAIYRRVLQPWFQPSVINHLDATIREGCESIIRPFADRGHCEFVGEFASKFPSQITLKLLGLPLDRVDAFLELEHDYLRGEVAEKIAAAGAILRCLEEVVEEKRRAPSDDLISRIVTAEIDGRRLNHGEVMGMCMLLYIGGLDTVTSSLGWYLRHLAQDQALQSRLRANPKEIPLAIEELLRLYGVSGTNRHVAKDCEFHGVTMKAGDRIAVPAMLAGRDPDRYQNPNVFDINRNNRHITFGTGVHNCLGSHLARREIRVVIEEFLARFTNIRIADGGTVAWLTEGIGPWGVSHLPLAWDTSPRS
jgi:cytochrome P450